jgi:adenosylcobinamide-phosphate synthase
VNPAWLALASLLLAVALDLALGDPPNRYHPVAWMGSLIACLTRGRQEDFPSLRDFGSQFTIGAAVTVCGALLFSLPLWLLLRWLAAHCWPLALLVNAVGLKMAISFRGLAQAAREVQKALALGDLPEARRLVSWHLVSRDTSALGPDQVAAATVESVAENLTDGLAAPIIFFLLGGLPAAWAYRFVNTCDSMLGYHDPVHEYLGKFPARLDDVLNWLPARLTGLLLVLGAAGAGADPSNAWRTMWAQHGRTASPNAGWTMSAMAGALSVTLEKIGHYRLEGGTGPLAPRTIGRALAVARVTVALLVCAASSALATAGWLAVRR